MEKKPTAPLLSDASIENGLGESTPRAEFEAWLEKLKPRQPLGESRTQSPSLEHHNPDFFIRCTQGDCQITFDGVVHIEGFVSSDIRSEWGSLIMGEGLIDGSIDVGAAYIDGSVIGNIRASERVVLYSEAKVAGNITSPALSTKPGALFEGDCILEEEMGRRLVPLGVGATAEFTEQM